MLEKQAMDIRILDVRNISGFTDFFVCCSSDSIPQTKAISDHVNDSLRGEGIKPAHIEGYQHSQWVLIDYINIIVNIMSQEARDFYDFERLWADAKITEVKDATIQSDQSQENSPLENQHN